MSAKERKEAAKREEALLVQSVLACPSWPDDGVKSTRERQMEEIRNKLGVNALLKALL